MNLTASGVSDFHPQNDTTLVMFLIFKALLPLLVYIPHAVSMRGMGLLQATIQDGDRPKIIAKYLKIHNDSVDAGRKANPIRVICISGKNLFAELQGGAASPLHEAAKVGQLEVLMPQTSKNNPTVRARYETYSAEFKTAHYPTIEKLVTEVQDCKTFLNKLGNKVMEHNVLCMWRVILFDQHCVVQSYFPNHRGCESDRSPIFVFRKGDESEFSYYHTFDEMFKLLTSAPAACISKIQNSPVSKKKKRGGKKKPHANSASPVASQMTA